MLTDAYGNQVDFKNTLIIMTSNIGSKLVLRGGRMGFGEAERGGELPAASRRRSSPSCGATSARSSSTASTR